MLDQKLFEKTWLDRTHILWLCCRQSAKNTIEPGIPCDFEKILSFWFFAEIGRSELSILISDNPLLLILCIDDSYSCHVNNICFVETAYL